MKKKVISLGYLSLGFSIWVKGAGIFFNSFKLRKGNSQWIFETWLICWKRIDAGKEGELLYLIFKTEGRHSEIFVADNNCNKHRIKCRVSVSFKIIKCEDSSFK